MTAMEMVRTILALTDRAGQLMRELTDLWRFSPANKRGLSDATFRRMSVTMPRSLFEPPPVLDGFVSFDRKAMQALNLFGAEHCAGDRAEQDYTGKVLVLSPDTLKASDAGV